MPIDPNYSGTIQSISINEVDGLITELQDKANQSALDIENQQRVSADSVLENNINLKLDKSRSIDSNLAFYATNRQSLSSVLSTIFSQGSVLSLGNGSYGNLTDTDPLVIDKQNIAIHAPPTGTNICEILSPVSIPSTSDRLRFQGITFDGNVILDASRSVYRRCDFTGEMVNIGAGATGYITIIDCEFSSNTLITVSNTFGNVLYFINCNFGSANIVLNQASNQQVIFNNCANFVSFPENATYVGINVLNTGYTKNSITKTILSSGFGNLGQVYTSGGANGVDTWTTPSGGGSGNDIIKERFSRYTLGQTVNTSRGNITLPNITTELQNTGASLSWIELTGSNIDYTPPINSSIVEFELSFYVFSSGRATSGIGLQFYIDNVPQTITRAKQPLVSGGASTYGQMRYNFKTTIEINGTNDATKCFVDTWNTSKNLKLRVCKLENETMSFHRVTLLVTDNPVEVTNTVVAPLLTITAY